MNCLVSLLGLLSLIAQEPTKSTIPSTPEAIRVLSIEVRQIDGEARYVAPSLASVQPLLAQVPGNHFTELEFHETSVPYGEARSVALGAAYTFSFRPSALTENDEVVFECHIDMNDGGKTVEALRVNGKLLRGKVMAFRGLPLGEGEMMVVMSLAEESDESQTSSSGGSGESRSGAGEPGSQKSSGVEGTENGPDAPVEKGPKTEPVPVLESREPVSPSDRAEAPLSGESTRIDSAPPKDNSTIEGILRALEEQDIQEQKNARGRRFDVVIRGDWW